MYLRGARHGGCDGTRLDVHAAEIPVLLSSRAIARQLQYSYVKVFPILQSIRIAALKGDVRTEETPALAGCVARFRGSAPVECQKETCLLEKFCNGLMGPPVKGGTPRTISYAPLCHTFALNGVLHADRPPTYQCSFPSLLPGPPYFISVKWLSLPPVIEPSNTGRRPYKNRIWCSNAGFGGLAALRIMEK
jgi:hypothetical protein